MNTLRATTSAGLVEIRKRLHDVCFDVPPPWVGSQPREIRLSGLDERLVLSQLRTWGPLAEFEQRRARVVLVVERAVELQIDDHAQTGRFDLVSLDFDADQRLLLIGGTLPVQLRIRVIDLDVRTEISDEMVPSGRVWRIRQRSG